jgi:hypothetical protein
LKQKKGALGMTPVASNPAGFVRVLAVCVVALFGALWAMRETMPALVTSDHVRSLVTTSPLLEGTRQSVVLLAFRLSAAMLCLVTSATLLTDKSPFEYTYAGQTVRLYGPGRAATFSVQTFFLMTAYFVGVSLLSALDVFGLLGDDALQPLGLVLNVAFRVLYPASFLVTLVVSFVLYPAAIAARYESQLQRLFVWPVLVMHCGNALLVQCELLLATPLAEDAHVMAGFCIPMLWGLWYVVFAWIFFLRTGVFFYFFMDWRNPGWSAPIAYAVLLGVLSLMNGLEVAMRYLIAQKSFVGCALSIPFTLLLCRFRDSRTAKKAKT